MSHLTELAVELHKRGCTLKTNEITTRGGSRFRVEDGPPLEHSDGPEVASIYVHDLGEPGARHPEHLRSVREAADYITLGKLPKVRADGR
jgi:hypothetical protein